MKIVVTDDQGRYLLPDLPKATYDIWVRGYGLVDSPKVKAQPGKNLDLKAVPAPEPRRGGGLLSGHLLVLDAEYPRAKLFPGTGPQGNGMPVTLKDQGQWLRYAKTDGCIHCHQLGDLATRTIPAAARPFQHQRRSLGAPHPVGPGGPRHGGSASASSTPQRQLSLLGDWTDRVAKGELPKTDPPRPTGIERNIVVTEWDWNTPNSLSSTTGFPPTSAIRRSTRTA